VTDPRVLLRHPDALECTLVLAAATMWLFRLTQESGGFHDPSTALTAIAFLPALLAVRPWRTVGRAPLLLTVLAGGGALLVLLRTSTGWEQADSPAGQILGAVGLVITAGFARTAGRRRAVVLVLLLAVMIEFLPGWKAWVGSGDPNHLLVGTFYWHNQLGIWMTALALVATAHAVAAKDRSRVVAAVVAPVAIACVVLSTSRTCLLLLVLGLLALLPLVLRSDHRVRAGLSWALAPVTALLLLLVLTSSLFFSKPWSGISAVESTANNPGALGNRGTSSLATNGGDRGRWAVAALTTWRDNPVLGDGFGSFRYTVSEHVPAGANISSFVHNGYAEALSSGGLVFGLPMLALWGLVGWAAVKRYLASLRPVGTDRSLYAGAAVAAGALLLHSAVDFDWHYPSLLVLLGVLGGLLLPRQERNGRVMPTAAVLVVVLALIATMSLVEHHGRTVIARGGTAQQLLDERWWGTDDPRIDLAALHACLHDDGGLACTPAEARRAVSVSSRAAGLDANLRSLRDRVARAAARWPGMQ
jgi:hypothetical protein